MVLIAYRSVQFACAYEVVGVFFSCLSFFGSANISSNSYQRTRPDLTRISDRLVEPLMLIVYYAFFKLSLRCNQYRTVDRT
jgi:hypothetical protein